MATVPTPTAQTAGTVVPAATINSQGNLATYLAGRTESGGARRPLCVMRQTVVQSLATGTDTAITFDAEDVDYDNGHSTTTNTTRYTANTAGWYHFDYCAAFTANATGFRAVKLQKNSTTDLVSQSVISAGPASAQTAVCASVIAFLNAGDWVEVKAQQSSGGALNTFAATGVGCYLTARWLSV